MKNIFFTGRIGVGKSTVIKRSLYGFPVRVGGFVSLPFVSDNSIQGFKIRDIKEGLEAEIGYFDEDFMIHPVAEGFETVGVSSLEGALKNADIVVMDELGFLESSAGKFKKTVLSVLQSDIFVLGVIKLERNTFLDEVAKMSEVIEVSAANRDYLPEEIRRMINEESLR